MSIMQRVFVCSEEGKSPVPEDTIRAVMHAIGYEVVVTVDFPDDRPLTVETRLRLGAELFAHRHSLSDLERETLCAIVSFDFNIERTSAATKVKARTINERMKSIRLKSKIPSDGALLAAMIRCVG